MNSDKIFLLRGNHELRRTQHNHTFRKYGARFIMIFCSLLLQRRSLLVNDTIYFMDNWRNCRECDQKFGTHYGPQVWNAANDIFDRMPIAAIVDNKVKQFTSFLHGLRASYPIRNTWLSMSE